MMVAVDEDPLELDPASAEGRMATRTTPLDPDLIHILENHGKSEVAFCMTPSWLNQSNVPLPDRTNASTRARKSAVRLSELMYAQVLSALDSAGVLESEVEERRACSTSSSSVFGEMCVKGRGRAGSDGRMERRAGMRRWSLGVDVGSQNAVDSVSTRSLAGPYSIHVHTAFTSGLKDH